MKKWPTIGVASVFAVVVAVAIWAFLNGAKPSFSNVSEWPSKSSSLDESSALWTRPPDLVKITDENLGTVFQSVEDHVLKRAQDKGVVNEEANQIASAAIEMLNRIVTGADLEQTLSELQSAGLIVNDNARPALAAYFDKGRSFPMYPTISPSSINVYAIYNKGRKEQLPALGSHSRTRSPVWDGMIPMGNDPEAGSYSVIEARMSVWMPLVPGGEPELQLWGFQFAKSPKTNKWLPFSLVKYTKLEPNIPKTVAITPM